jgi:hypothetical protein
VAASRDLVLGRVTSPALALPRPRRG